MVCQPVISMAEPFVKMHMGILNNLASRLLNCQDLLLVKFVEQLIIASHHTVSEEKGVKYAFVQLYAAIFT